MPVNPFCLSHWPRQTAIQTYVGVGKAGGQGSIAHLEFKGSPWEFNFCNKIIFNFSKYPLPNFLCQ